MRLNVLHYTCLRRLYTEWHWRCVRVNNKDYIQQNNHELTQQQSYKVEDILFVVEPVFKEDNSKTLSTALFSLMRDEVDDM